jgi:hypothetical protein
MIINKGADDMTLDILLWLLIAVGGMVGGFLFGIRDRRLELPHREDQHSWNPGCLVDILFGLAGGFVIFIIVPGSFDYRAGGWETIQILALAGVGGYGGRALVEKLINEQLQELEKNVQQIQKQDRSDAIAIKLLDQHLDDDADTPLVPEDSLRRAIVAASSSAKVIIFERARQFRKECQAIAHKRARLPQVVPVFESLINDDPTAKYHRNHAQLGFVLKDQPQPDWRRAEAELSAAIEIRNRQGEQGFLAYEFNRAICRIQLGYPLEEIKKDLEAALGGEKTAGWVRQPDPLRAPGLESWLERNRQALQPWLERHALQPIQARPIS